LLRTSAATDLADEWGPQLLSGAWGATICISEPDAGSDVGRIRTRARRSEDGAWRITGEKCWISYGDHDLTGRIGHLMLARSGEDSRLRGLSLFLVPDGDEQGSAMAWCCAGSRKSWACTARQPVCWALRRRAAI
jgi:alkylation response protein AidB-like acyl-CoA dehydrogenase